MKRFTFLLIALCIIGWSGSAFAGVTFNLKGESFEKDLGAAGFDWTDTTGGSGSSDEFQADGTLYMESVYGEFGFHLPWDINPYFIAGFMNLEVKDFDNKPASLWSGMDFSSGKASEFFGGGINIPILKKARFELMASAKFFKVKIDDLEWNYAGEDITTANVSGFALPTGYDAELELSHCEAGISGKLRLFQKFPGFAITGGVYYSASDLNLDLDEIYPGGTVTDDFNWDGDDVLFVGGVEIAFSDNASFAAGLSKEKVYAGFDFRF